mgnify:CR=1 FL=1
MRALVVGYGSIGKRHIKNLSSIPNMKIIVNTKRDRDEFLENKNSFSEQDWKELYKLSEETFVEESESLRSKGAGAGLTDND